MKNILVASSFLFALLPVFGRNVKDVVLPDEGGIKNVLTTAEAMTIDSIHISGSNRLTSNDFYFLARMCERGKLTGIDLSEVQVVGDSIPERIFMSKSINGVSAKSSDGSPLNVNLRYLRLPKNVRYICDMAFFGTNLVEMEIPKTVDYIGSKAFGECYELRSFTVANPSPATIFADYAFDTVNSDAVLNVPVGSAAQYSSSPGWSSFCSVTEKQDLYNTLHINLDGKPLEELYGETLLHTDSLVVTGRLATSDFAALRNAINLGRLTSINLRECTIEGNVLPESAFGSDSYKSERKNYGNLLYIALPEGLTSIGAKAFAGVQNLRVADIPKTVTTIGEKAFHNCIRLGGTLSIPEGVTVLQPETFENCRLITQINLPSTLEEMGDLSLCLHQAEWMWKLTTVRINRKTPPVMMKESDKFAFGCDEVLERVSIGNCTLYVPVGSRAAYMASPMWRDFLNIIETPKLDGGTSGMGNTFAVGGQNVEERIYTIDGRYVGTDMSNLGKGVYVVNGKKVVK